MSHRLAFVALLVTLLLAPAARADETVATLDRVGPLAAFQDRLVWSAYDAATNTYKLMTRAGGITSEVPVPARPEPFDVDLGPGPNGRVTAAYTRCEPRCTVRLHEFGGPGGELSISGTSDSSNPAVWRSRVAYERGGRLYVRTAGGSGVTRYPGGPRGYEVSDLDLYGQRLAVVWRNNATEGHREELRLATTPRRVRTVARASSGALSLAYFTGPTFANGSLFAVRVRLAEAGNRFMRYGVRSQRLAEVRGRASVLGAAADGTRFYVLKAGGGETGDCPCPLVATDPVAFP
jgi:hypothetical protein